MEIQIAVAKVNKYAVSESGDTLEVVERPTGGLSVVLADGQTSGRGAKAVSLLVVRKVIGLMAEGVRDGAAARAASDALFADKAGKVTCTLNIASVDLHSKTIVLTRNNPVPVFICRGEANRLAQRRKHFTWHITQRASCHHRNRAGSWSHHCDLHRRDQPCRRTAWPTDECW